MSFGGSSLSDTLINPIKNSVTKWPWEQEFVNPKVGLDAIQEGFFAKPVVPEVAPVTSTASTVTDDSAAKAAAAAEAERLRKKKGYKSTILTEGDAMMTQAPTQKAELLG